MSIKPVRPQDVIHNRSLDYLDKPGGPFEMVNDTLSKPWTRYEKNQGRNIDARKFRDSIEREAIIEHFERSGWKVTEHDDQREGSWLNFKPAPFLGQRT